MAKEEKGHRSEQHTGVDNGGATESTITPVAGNNISPVAPTKVGHPDVKNLWRGE